MYSPPPPPSVELDRAPSRSPEVIVRGSCQGRSWFGQGRSTGGQSCGEARTGLRQWESSQVSRAPPETPVASTRWSTSLYVQCLLSSPLNSSLRNEMTRWPLTCLKNSHKWFTSYISELRFLIINRLRDHFLLNVWHVREKGGSALLLKQWGYVTVMTRDGAGAVRWLHHHSGPQ